MNTSSFISQRLTPPTALGVLVIEHCDSIHHRGFFASPVDANTAIIQYYRVFYWSQCSLCRLRLHCFLMDGLRRFRIHFKAWHSLSLFSFPTESKVKPEDHTWYYISVISALQAPCARTLQRVHPLEFIWSCIPYDWWTRSPNGNDQQELAGVTLGPRP